MSKRVLVLTNSIGGIHSFRKEVMKAIIDADYELYISAPDDDVTIPYFEEIGCHIIRTLFDRRGTNPISDFKLMWSYCKLIKQIKPVAVLTYTIKPNVYGGLACRITHTHQLANITGLGDTVENGGIMHFLTLTLYKIGLSRARKIFFQNKDNLNFCVTHKIAGKNTCLLPGSGVNLNHHVYQPYPSDEGKVRFLFIGRLLKDKGIEELFESAQYIKGKYPNTEFRILGVVEGPYQSLLDKLVEAGTIQHLGITVDVRPYIGDVECTIMPSYHEGMSNVNLESAANGRPVITTNVPGCKETVDDGITGYLVNSRDAADLRRKVEQFILLPYEQKVIMGQEARKKVVREFDRRIVVDAYLNEIKLC